MESQNKKNNSKKNNKKDGSFGSKHINHDPQAESARAVFTTEGAPHPGKIWR